MDDFASKLLAAIDEEEQRARRDAGDEQHQQRMAECGDLNEGYIVDLALDRLRRCAADREILELHHIVWRDIGWLAEEDGEVVEEEAELPVCGLCVERHSSFPRRDDVPVGSCRTVRLLARGYGISAEEKAP